MILTIFTSCICTFYNLTFKNTRNKTINNEIKENKTKIVHLKKINNYMKINSALYNLFGKNLELLRLVNNLT